MIAAAPPEVQHYRFSMADFDRLHEVGILTEDDRVEFLDGELIAMSAIGERHVGCLNWLNRTLVLASGSDYVVSIQNPLRLRDRASFLPDIVVFRAAGRRNRIPTPEETILVFEIADSSRTYDRGTKFPQYAHAGIPEAWLVDLQHDRLERHTGPLDDGYGHVLVARRGESIASTVLPGLVLDVDAVLGPPGEGE